MGRRYEQLMAEEWAVIMMIKADNRSARQIALAPHRAPSTIARELERFGARPDRPASPANTLAAYDTCAAFVPGAPFYANNPDHASLRLSFATVGVDKIEEGVRRLAQAL
jgi:hypothetical protein